MRHVPDARFTVGEEDPLSGSEAQGQRQVLLSEVDGGTGAEPDRRDDGRLQSRQDRHEGSVHTAAEHGPAGTANVHAAGFDNAARTDAHGRATNDVHAADDAATRNGADADGCSATNDAPDAAKHEAADDGQPTS